MQEIHINPSLILSIRTVSGCRKHKEKLSEWINRPYIETVQFTRDSLIEYIQRTMLGGFDYDDLENDVIFDQLMSNAREEWLKLWTSGIRFDVKIFRCDEWRISSRKGSYGTLEEAIAAATALKQ